MLWYLLEYIECCHWYQTYKCAATRPNCYISAKWQTLQCIVVFIAAKVSQLHSCAIWYLDGIPSIYPSTRQLWHFSVNPHHAISFLAEWQMRTSWCCMLIDDALYIVLLHMIYFLSCCFNMILVCQYYHGLSFLAQMTNECIMTCYAKPCGTGYHAAYYDTFYHPNHAISS